VSTKFSVPSATATGTDLTSGSTANDTWTRRQTASPDARREYEAERLATWAAELIAREMAEQDLTKAELAKRLGKSRAFVTQVLSGQRNLTLRTFADLAWACGHRVVVTAEPLRQGQFVSQPVSRRVGLAGIAVSSYRSRTLALTGEPAIARERVRKPYKGRRATKKK
jgi:transcriptional regulator with XRE-family HTH domain